MIVPELLVVLVVFFLRVEATLATRSASVLLAGFVVSLKPPFAFDERFTSLLGVNPKTNSDNDESD